ncbi:hypothetical protein ACHAWF_003114 [Thalassiosira exigua]
MEAMARDLAVGAIAPALRCCAAELGSTIALENDREGSLELEDRKHTKENAMQHPQQEEKARPPPRRIRLSARMGQEMRRSSRDLMASFTICATSQVPSDPSAESDSSQSRSENSCRRASISGPCSGKGRSSPVSAYDAAHLVAQEYFAEGGKRKHDIQADSSHEMDELFTMPSLLVGSEVEQEAAEKKCVSAPSDMETSEKEKSQLDEEIDRLFGVNTSQEMDELFVMPTDTVIAKEMNGVKSVLGGARASFTATATTCSESAHSSEDVALAREVGLSAHEYLEECFYTEVAVLNREKFNAVPEIVKSDFALIGHLGKGSFSDVFEVVCKGGRLLESKPSGCAPPPAPPRRPGRMRRTSISSSINVATLSRAPRAGGATRRRYALKCLRPQIRSDVDQFTIGAEDLVHETAILANLDHPNIIKLHGRASGSLMDAFILNDGYFVLLDKLDETLVDRLEAWKQDPARPRMGPGRAQLEVARTVAKAMRYLHSKRIVLRDLKPANVGFDPQGTLKLFDFGFASGLPEASSENPGGLLEDRCGTPRYMAPEVGLSLGYAHPADVYSFGILLWEMCSLSKPFAHIHSTGAFDNEVFVGGARPPVGSGWPAAVSQLMESCWVTLPGQRPTMDEVLSRLSSIPDDASMNKEGRGPQSLIKAKKVGARAARFRRSTLDFGRF